jgi:hypothetical protein
MNLTVDVQRIGGDTPGWGSDGLENAERILEGDERFLVRFSCKEFNADVVELERTLVSMYSFRGCHGGALHWVSPSAPYSYSQVSTSNEKTTVPRNDGTK